MNGRLSSITSGGTAVEFSYDAAGRIAMSRQMTSGNRDRRIGGMQNMLNFGFTQVDASVLILQSYFPSYSPRLRSANRGIPPTVLAASHPNMCCSY